MFGGGGIGVFGIIGCGIGEGCGGICWVSVVLVIRVVVVNVIRVWWIKFIVVFNFVW